MNIKERLLKGIQYRKKMVLNGEEAIEVTLRPLTDYEASILQGITLSGMGIEIDLEKVDASSDLGKQIMKGMGTKMSGSQIASIFRSSAEVNRKVCAWGIVDEEGKSIFTEEEIQQGFIGGITAKIAEEIKSISGMQEDEVSPFR